MRQQRPQTDTFKAYGSPQPMKLSSVLFTYVANFATFVQVY